MFKQLKLNQLNSLFTGVCALLLVACGGGGGSAGGGGGVAPSTPLAIDDSNSKTIAAEVIETTLAIGDASTTILGAKTDSGSGLSINDINKQLVEIIANNQSNTALVSGVVYACGLGGSITAPDNGGNGRYVFSNCVEQGIIFDGTLTISGNGDFFNNFNGSFSYSNFTITTSLGTDVADGTITVSWTFSGGVTTGAVSTSLLSFVSGSDYYDLINFNNNYTLNDNTQIETDNVAFTLNSSVLNGQVMLTTTADIQTNYLSLYPFAGQVICTGAANSKVRATVNPGGTGLSSDTLTIETDADGDNIYESSQVYMWSEL